jgi:hypothetical protein
MEEYMSIRRFASLAAIAAVAVMAFGAASASATTTLRLDPGNTPFSGATTISNTTARPAVLTTNIGVVTCNQTFFSADVNSHSSATTITGKLTSLTFTSCTDTIAPVNITSCTLHAGSPLPTVHVLGTSSAGGTVSVNGVVERCSVQASTNACYYAQNGAAPGTAVNSTSSITYTNIPAVSSAPTTDALASGLCGATATFSTTLTHIVQTSTNRTVTITS